MAQARTFTETPRLHTVIPRIHMAVKTTMEVHKTVTAVRKIHMAITISHSISPGWIQNEDYRLLKRSDHNQHPSGRVGRPSDIASACLFLAAPENDFINGQNIVIDGGMTKKMIYE